ncbi:MAG: sel1 repeat family protein, partial [Clostridia bacterium]|nr:sel1 repeat family protein [Clostridia bacterium]
MSNINELSFDELLKLAESGEAEAQYKLALRYHKANGVEEDFEKAMYWYEQSANQGYLNAQAWLGCNYRNGYNYGMCVDVDYEKALYWYGKAAEQGDAESIEEIKTIREIIRLQEEYNRKYGLDINLDEELKAAEQGNVDSQMKVANYYENATDGNVDLKKAAYWYGQAAKQGNSKAQYKYGSFCEHGLTDETNCIEKALYWYEQSAKNGCAEAQYCLGLWYQTGYYSGQDLKKSVYWYEQAAKNGNVVAQKRMAIYYANGEVVEQDDAKMAHWYSQAAIGGDMESQYRIAICYEEGVGVEKDVEKAAYWYKRA